MEIKYGSIIRTQQKACKTCFTLTYYIPCEVESNLASYLVSFGSPKFDLNTVKLFKIETEDDYIIKTRLGSTLINLSFPKNLEGTNIVNNFRKIEFEAGIIKWLENKLDIKIIK